MSSRRTSPVFSPRMIRLYRSWSWVREDFADEFDRLSDAGAFRPDGASPAIWHTRTKFVLRVPTSRGFDAAYKSYYKIRNFHQYIIRPSDCASEASNYVMLAELGFPLPDLGVCLHLEWLWRHGQTYLRAVCLCRHRPERPAEPERHREAQLQQQFAVRPA